MASQEMPKTQTRLDRTDPPDGPPVATETLPPKFTPPMVTDERRPYGTLFLWLCAAVFMLIVTLILGWL